MWFGSQVTIRAQLSCRALESQWQRQNGGETVPLHHLHTEPAQPTNLMCASSCGPLGIEPRWLGSRLNVLTVRLWPTTFTHFTFIRLELAHRRTYAHLFEGKRHTSYFTLTHFLVEIGMQQWAGA